MKMVRLADVCVEEEPPIQPLSPGQQAVHDEIASEIADEYSTSYDDLNIAA